MTENKRFIPIFDGFDKRVVGARDNGKIISFIDMFDLLNELNDENRNLKKENKDLEELLHLITRIFLFEKEESVKELLRNEIKGLDIASYESARAWHNYCILSKFFKERYDEDWDNE